MTLAREIKWELDNLDLQYPGKATLTMDDISALCGIVRKHVSGYIKRHGIPYVKTGQTLTVSKLDLAQFRAKNKRRADAPPDPRADNRGAVQLEHARQMAQ